MAKGTLPFVFLSALVVAAGLFVGLFYLKKADADENGGPGFGGRPTPVVVQAVATEELANVVEALGTARANESVVLTSKVVDTVRAVHFEDGDFVEEGAILVELTDTEEHAQLQGAVVTFEEAEKQLERIRSLIESNAMAEDRLDVQIALAAAARARVESIKAQLADRLITAPFSGLLGFRLVSPGSLVSPGQEITTLDDIDLIKLDFTVPEVLLADLRVGQEIEARSSAFPSQVFVGRVATIGSRVDPITRSITIRAHIENTDRFLRPGMLLTVQLYQGRGAATVIPEEAIVPIEERQYVYVVDSENKAMQVEVTTGRRSPGSVEVISGLEVGQKIVIDGTMNLRPGADVQITTGPADVSS